MNRIVCFLLLLTFVTSCSQAEISIEEEILMRSFVSFYSAEAFDEFCNGADPKDKYDFDKPENINRMGNMQLLVARIGGLQHLRHPKMSVDTGVEKLIGFSKEAKKKATALYEEKGCDSEEAKSAQAALQLYTTVHPAAVNGLIDKEITKRGGTITPPVKTTEMDGAENEEPKQEP